MEKMHEFSDIILVINFSVVDKWTNKSNSRVTATAENASIWTSSIVDFYWKIDKIK